MLEIEKIIEFKKMSILKNLIVFTLVVFTSISLWGQNPKRTVLFALGENESIVSYEYYIAKHFNGNRFYCTIENINTNIWTFVFNGKRIVSSKKMELNVLYSNVNEENGYIISYIKDGAWYVNCKGKENGPYDNIYRNIYYNIIASANNYDYCYKLAGRWYGHKNGTNKRVDFVEQFYENGKYYANINGNISQGYEDVGCITLTESGKYAYCYREKGKKYANINGNISQGYEGVWNITLTESGKYAYCYREKGKNYVNINGNISQGYEDVGCITLT